MIKIIPFGQRELTKKSLAKIWNLFPNDEFCMVYPKRDLKELYKARRVITYYTVRGKNFSVEIDPTRFSWEVEMFVRLGVRKFYFIWYGLQNKFLFFSSDALQYALYLTQKYKDMDITIVYELPYEHLYNPPDFDLIETSIVFLGRFLQGKTRLHGRFRRPHPWYGIPRIKKIKELEKLACGQGNFDIESQCGCKTVISNTNIYCCPFCERKIKKKRFGDADRDKYVCGTVDRGVFREIICNQCECLPTAKSCKISYINRG